MKTNTFIADRDGGIDLTEPDFTAPHRKDTQDFERNCLTASKQNGGILLLSCCVTVNALLSLRQIIEGELMARAASVMSAPKRGCAHI